jgi:hypothetical protein
MAEEARRELGEAVEAVEELIDANSLPFGRWVIQLFVKEVLVKAIIPAGTALVTSICGWYFIGQTQLEGRALDAGARAAEVQVEKLDRARELVSDVEPLVGSPRVFAPLTEPKPLSDAELEVRLEEVRDRWEAKALEESSSLEVTEGAANTMDRRILEQKARFPEGYVRERLSKARK